MSRAARARCVSTWRSPSARWPIEGLTRSCVRLRLKKGKLGAKGGVAKGGKGAKPKDPEVVDEKRVKRLMRNRVSAQQARERRKHYVGNLEERARQLELENEQLIEQVQTLRRESDMLRSILKATRLN